MHVDAHGYPLFQLMCNASILTNVQCDDKYHFAGMPTLILGMLSPTVKVTFEEKASEARQQRYWSVQSWGMSSASAREAMNQVSIWAMNFSSIIWASMMAIFFSFSLSWIFFSNSMSLTSYLDSASMIILRCWVISFSTITFSRSTSMQKSTFFFSMASKLAWMAAGMSGLVTRMERSSMPGAHTARSLLREVIRASSNLSKMSMYISCSECLEQNWLISWCSLSVIQNFSQSSVQLRTVSYTNSFRSLLTTSTLLKYTMVPLEVPQGMLVTTSVSIRTLISMNSWQNGILKWTPGSLSCFWRTPKFLQTPTQPYRTLWKPDSMSVPQRAATVNITPIRPIKIL